MKNKKSKKGKDDDEDGLGGGLKAKKSPSTRRAASPMLSRKTPQIERKGAKTPSAIK